jgi:hypothetical protein
MLTCGMQALILSTSITASIHYMLAVCLSVLLFAAHAPALVVCYKLYRVS